MSYGDKSDGRGRGGRDSGRGGRSFGGNSRGRDSGNDSGYRRGGRTYGGSGGSGGSGRSGGRSYGGDRGYDKPREMFKTICADCGKETEVPFKPSPGGKPVYCRDCLKKHRKY